MDDAQPVDGPASDGVLDIDAATNEIAAFDDVRPEDEDEGTEENTTDEVAEESEADPTAEDGEADPDEEATAETDDEDEAEAEEPPIQPPHSWDKESKEWFSTLDRKTQEIVSARENERDRATAQKLNEAAEARKLADQRSSEIEQYAEVFGQIAKNAKAQFANRWEGMDWEKAAQQLDPQQYNQLKAQYERDQHILQQTTQAQQAAEAQSHREFLQREQARLPEVAPDLADPEKGAERRQKLAKFLTDQGVDKEALKWASADELGLAYDAMRYRELQAQPKTTAKPTPKPAPKAVKPGAQAKTTPRKAQVRTKAMKRLGTTGSVDDATAAILAIED
ncbi:MAG: hypothetical protein VX529_10970 [Pseudomonadota bacterium]|nr:hypothetical protein [Pseudomonadota bacterium]